MLDGVEDPHNLGACLRTADAAGIDAVVVPRDHSADAHAGRAKAATGAAETVPVRAAPNLARTLTWLKEAGVWIVGPAGDGGAVAVRGEARRPVALVLGGGRAGPAAAHARDCCDQLCASR